MDFSLSNLPLATGRVGTDKFICTRVKDMIISLKSLVLHYNGLHPNLVNALKLPTLDAVLALSPSERRALRDWMVRFVAKALETRMGCYPETTVSLDGPFPAWKVGDYTDFYASIHHAETVGRMLRGEANALQANWKRLPVGYHGRSSSIVVSGTNFHRPCGQIDNGALFGPCKKLDYELELGCVLGGTGNALGSPLSVREANEAIFGYVLLNDWSARDVQTWEYVPLGPFCAKNFCTTISPWIITREALEPHRVRPTIPGSWSDPSLLAYLYEDASLAALNLNLSVEINATPVCNTNYANNMYWSFSQMIAHHTSTGCNLRSGDLLGSGTVSGPTSAERGCLLESTLNGSKPIRLRDGTERSFLMDGDSVALSGFAQLGDDAETRVGFGACVGTVLPPLQPPNKL